MFDADKTGLIGPCGEETTTSRFHRIPERNGLTDGRTDERSDRQTDLLYRYRA